MKSLIATNDVVLISVVTSLLEEAGIEAFVADNHMSTMEGSLGFLPRRILVIDDDLDRARRLLVEAGFGAELAPSSRP